MIELAILGLLAEQELHGYELKKQLAELLGPWSSVSFGSLYPALARLEKAGRVKAVEAHTLDAPTTPMTGALSGELAAFRTRLTGKAPKPAPRTTPADQGANRSAHGDGPDAPAPRTSNRRGKKVYGITSAGRDRLHDLLLDDAHDDERSFGVRVAFCTHLSPAERIELFERRRAELLAQLSTRRKVSRADAPTSPAPRRSDLYRRSLRERDTRTLTNDLAWLDELLAATRETETAHDAAPAHQPRRHLTDPALHAPTATFVPARPPVAGRGPVTHPTAPSDPPPAPTHAPRPLPASSPETDPTKAGTTS